MELTRRNVKWHLGEDLVGVDVDENHRCFTIFWRNSMIVLLVIIDLVG